MFWKASQNEVKGLMVQVTLPDSLTVESEKESHTCEQEIPNPENDARETQSHKVPLTLFFLAPVCQGALLGWLWNVITLRSREGCTGRMQVRLLPSFQNWAQVPLPLRYPSTPGPASTVLSGGHGHQLPHGLTLYQHDWEVSWVMVITTQFSASLPSLSCLFPPQRAPGYNPRFLFGWIALWVVAGLEEHMWTMEEGLVRIWKGTHFYWVSQRHGKMLATLATLIQVVEINLFYSSTWEIKKGKKFKSGGHLAMAESEGKARSILLQNSFCDFRTVNDKPLNWMDYGVSSLHRTDL